MAVLKPCPGTPPIRLAAGTRQSSKITSYTLAPAWPIFLLGLPTVRPGLFFSTMNAETPPAPLFDGSVRAIRVKIEASAALVM